MALKPLNSVGGFSVGEVPANVILANADITANNATFSGNVLISNSTNTWGVLTDNLYYSNGVPWDFQQAAGSNGELQFNMGDDFAASPNLTFDNSTQLFTVTGNANITGTLTVGSITTSSLANGNSNIAIPAANGNVNISVAGNANVLVVTGTGANVNGYLDVSGNAVAANLNLDNGYVESLGTSGLSLVPANATAGITLFGNTVPNSNVGLNLGATNKVWANIYGNNVIVSANLDSGNANLGNLAVANYVNVNNNLNVTDNIFAGNLQVNVAANISNISIANFVTSNLTPSSDDQYSLGTSLKRWKDINIAGNANIAVANVSGNLSAGNTNFGNLLSGNYANFANDIQVLGNIANANNVSVTNALQANTGNFSGNITSLNANLGNLVNANFANFQNNVNVNGTLNTLGIEANGNISISNSNPAYGIKTDNLYYSNGQPWDLQQAAGSNTQVQFNNNNDFGASANFTFNTATDTLTVTGNANVTNTLLTPNVNSGTSNLNVTSNGFTTVFDNTGNVTFPGDVTAGTFYGNVSGNITTSAANTSVLFSDAGLIAGANSFTFDKTSNLFTTPGNITVNGDALVTGNANFAGNSISISQNYITGNGTGIVLKDDTNGAQLEWNANAFVFVDSTGASLEANGFIANLDMSGNFNLPNNLSVVGNIANANNITATNNIVAGADISANAGNVYATNFQTTGSGGNITGANVVSANTFSGNLQASYANVTGNTTTANLTVNAEIGGNTANFSGNVILPNLQVNLHLAGNTANFTGNLVAANANLGNLAQANYVNVANNLTTLDANVTGTLTVANANISSNLSVSNLTVNLELSGNTANLIGNVVLSGAQVTVNNHLAGNTANFSGNITSLNANLGNIADANYLRTSEIYNGNSNVIITPNGNISLSATGTGNVVVVSNVGANVIGYVTANGNGTFGAVKSNSVTAQGGNLELYSFQSGNTYIQLRPFGDGTVDVGNTRITSLATPNAASDAATKQYVDDVAQGLNVHDSAYTATGNTLAILTGGTITYNNGTGGVGANLVLSGSPTANYLSANVFDGNTQAVVGSRILVKNEANAAHNGVYVVDSSTVLTRASDYNSVPEVEAGDFIFVQDGTQYNDTGWVQTSVVTTIGTDPINFTQFSGAGTYQAGAGLTLTGTVFSVNVDNVTTEISGGNVIVKANAQLTTPNIGAATGTSLDLTGNLLAGNVNSNALVTAANIQVTSNVLANNFSANSNITSNNATINLALSGNTANFSGNVILPNLEVNLALVGNTANFSGNVIVPNLTVNTTLSGNVANFTGNLTSLNANLGNLATANYINVANLLTTLDANVTGTLTVANANIGGNITVNNLTVNLELQANTANFDGNVTMDSWLYVANTANVGNLRTDNLLYSNGQPWDFQLPAGSNTQVQYNDGAGSFGASANFTFDVATSTLAVTGNANVSQTLNGNVGNFSGNITAANLLANGVANVGNLNVVGNVTSDLLPNANLTHDLGIATQRWDNVYAGNVNASGNITISGNNLTTGNTTANNITANTSVDVGNTSIYWGQVTTTSVAANQTISTVSVSGVTGIEWIVKGIDSSGAKYSMAIVTAVSDGANADYSQFGGVNLGSTTGTLAVNVVGSNVELQVTPSSSNSTVWVTQYRTI